MSYRNSKPRHTLDETRTETRYLLRRFFCDVCHKLHTEIPDTIQPFKHYDSKTVQDVLDGGGDTCSADDSTMRRWRADFRDSEDDVNRRLESIRAKETHSHTSLMSGQKLLNTIRKENQRWLAFVMGLLIRHGHRLRTRFAFCQDEDGCRVVLTGRTEEAEGG